jgi:tRNA-modifying protein YgfZ
MAAAFCELCGTGLIAVSGRDAGAFLQAQLTNDVGAMAASQTAYGGYCSPQGRLLATFLVWRCGDEFLLQLPEELRETIQTRLSKYVLRARVHLTRAPNLLFGLWGPGIETTVSSLAGRVPQGDHEVVFTEGVCITRLAATRYLLAAQADRADFVRAALTAGLAEAPEAAWAALDVAAGVPVITPATQDRYVPQMVNLDLIGGVSYSKGCYPGQEIVARMHYLGRLKQRMYRVHVPASDVRPGDPLFSEAFGPDQASGALLNVAASAQGGHEALAVLQISAAAHAHWKSPSGPAVVLQDLPYAVPPPA